MIRTELMRELGGFDPRFFLYWEEVDLCARADAVGAETWAVGSAEAFHVGGASSDVDDTRISGCIARYFYQSRTYYMRKHHGWLRGAAAELIELVLLGGMTFVDLLRGRGTARIRPRLQARPFSQPRPA